MGSSDRRQIERLFKGQWDRAGFGAPQLWPRQRNLIARTALSRAALWHCCDPRFLAVELGYFPVWGSVPGCGGEVTANRVILVRAEMDRREEGLNLHHGIAHALLEENEPEHSEADVWWLTAELAAPTRALREWGVERVVAAAFAPEWFVRAWANIAALEPAPLTPERLVL